MFLQLDKFEGFRVSIVGASDKVWILYCITIWKQEKGTDSRTIDPRLIPDHKLGKSKRIPEKHILCFMDYAKAFDDGTTLPASWETCMQVKKQEIET